MKTVSCIWVDKIQAYDMKTKKLEQLMDLEIRLEPSITCSSFITKSFRSEVDPNGINWISVSNDVKDGYFGEFKAAIKYKNFISKIKGGGIWPGFVPEHVWKGWMQLWGTDESIKKSETNSKNRCGGREVAAGTHMGGSISIGEYRKRLETYEEILQEKMASQSDTDQFEAYYHAAGGEKKRRIYGLGSKAKNYYKHKLCASSFVRPSVSQSASTTNMDEFVNKMLHALTNHLLPVIMEQVQEMITPVDNLTPLTPIVPPPATTNEVDPLVSSDDDAIP
ncbi:hypothetical protein KY289_013269 [Solanum tuberosum]|nr:hypothetical protein KY289_013269 [Solanum tuberosum]